MCGCGLPMSRNPHPEAGNLEVTTYVWVCIPCMDKALGYANDLRLKAERQLSVMTARAEAAEADNEKLRRRIDEMLTQNEATIEALQVMIDRKCDPLSPGRLKEIVRELECRLSGARIANLGHAAEAAKEN